jgi:uncharacterized membrane protein YeaQ/YmgE (transglycosylase-associated protein family)
MSWTLTNLVIQIIAGIVGGHIAAAAVRDHSFGHLGHTAVGALGGAFSGYFFQTLASTMVTGSGSMMQPTAVDEALIQALTGLAAGAIFALATGYVLHAIRTSKRGDGPHD